MNTSDTLDELLNSIESQWDHSSRSNTNLNFSPSSLFNSTTTSSSSASLPPQPSYGSLHPISKSVQPIFSKPQDLNSSSRLGYISAVTSLTSSTQTLSSKLETPKATAAPSASPLSLNEFSDDVDTLLEEIQTFKTSSSSSFSPSITTTTTTHAPLTHLTISTTHGSTPSPFKLESSSVALRCNKVSQLYQCTQLRCPQCDFMVLSFPNFRWIKQVTYLTFRQHMPNVDALKGFLEEKKNYIAKCCQCAWYSIPCTSTTTPSSSSSLLSSSSSSSSSSPFSFFNMNTSKLVGPSTSFETNFPSQWMCSGHSLT